ncbi:hypothetical protein CU044_1541 [Streptomyces sp. L-9-10]|nr:hypothetical protein CU044_1541 [Streptomyces sp. L-9-10]
MRAGGGSYESHSVSKSAGPSVTALCGEAAAMGGPSPDGAELCACREQAHRVMHPR